jgi:hypothetical protein
MERRIDVGAGIGEQLDLADLKGRTRRVASGRGVAREPIADDRRGKTAVGDHAVLDLMTQIDQARRHGSRSAAATSRA